MISKGHSHLWGGLLVTSNGAEGCMQPPPPEEKEPGSIFKSGKIVQKIKITILPS
jgi:hypothetical protein